ncbi:hypothetical protein SANTM175S_08773 [Streptomyces antimycoticus]
MSGETAASVAIASESGIGQRTSFQSGVVSRHTNSAIRNQVRYQGSSRLKSYVGSSSAQRLNSVYATSKST